MRCQKCQFDHNIGAKFCNECGNQLEFVCPQCENLYRPGTNFCDECGYELQALNKENTSIAYDRPQSYTPRHLADNILTTRASIEGERKVVTVLFWDGANSTAVFEKLDEEDLFISFKKNRDHPVIFFMVKPSAFYKAVL